MNKQNNDGRRINTYTTAYHVKANEKLNLTETELNGDNKASYT